MKRNGVYVIGVVVTVLFTLSATVRAQSTIQRQDSLFALEEEYQSLSRIFNTLNAGDTVYTPFFPRWSVQDRGLKLRICGAFRNHGINFDPTDPIHVIVTPDQQEIVDVRIGKVGFGKMYSKFVLARDLHQTLLARKYEHKMEVPAGYGSE
jgi:hypothetical protein